MSPDPTLPTKDAARDNSNSLSATPMRRMRAEHWLMACGFLLAIAIFAGAVAMVVNLYSRSMTAHARELENTTQVLADQTDRAFEAVLLMQAGLVERMRDLNVASAADYERAMSGYSNHLMLKDKVGNWPHVGSLTLINADGKLFNFSRFWPLPDIDVTDRDFFQVLKSDPQATFFMSKPVRNRATGSWTIHLARKISGPDGEFFGLVTGAMEMEYFTKYFGSLRLESGSSISLFRNDGVLLASFPHIDPTQVRSHQQNAPLLDVISRAKDGIYEGTITRDGGDHLIVARKLTRNPFVITASKPVDEVLAEWRRAAIYIALATGLLIAVVAIVVVLGIRQIKSYETLLKARADHDQRTHLDAAINNMPHGLVMFDASEQMVICNRRYLEMYGLSPEIVRPGCTVGDLLLHRQATGSFTGDIERYRREIRDRFSSGTSYDSIAATSDGRLIRIVNTPLASGGWVGTHEDVTERQGMLGELERTQTFLNTIFENVPVTIYVKDARDGRYILVNRAAEKLWGKGRDEALGKTAHELFSRSAADAIAARDQEFLRSRQRTLSHVMHRVEMPDGSSRLVISKRLAIYGEDNEPRYLLGVIEDITESERANEKITFMAHHDLLTGLANRALFKERIEQARARLHQHGEAFSILMIDLDHFKDVNDTLGHQVGDALLKAVAERLQSTLCETDVLARLGGDEFAILQSAPANHHAAAVDLANRILESVAKPFEIESAMLTVGASIGIGQAPGDGTELNDLMKKADLALYRQKSDGRNGYRFFDDQMMADFDARHRLGNELRNAIHNNELDLHYQRIVDATTRRPCAAEALIRWNRPGRGNVTPDEFIPLAEENGLIVPIGEWVLLRACQDAVNWPDHIKVAVNLSPVQFKKANLFDVILFALVESGLPPERLELELTELILIENHTEILPTIRQLKNLGVSIVLDDFGTGYSSLRYLTMFPFNKIKIDQSFTRDMTKRAECAAVISSVLTIGRILDISVTAEGVETEQQFTVLRAAGVNTVQGYLFGKPCPGSQLDFGHCGGDQLAEAVA